MEIIKYEAFLSAADNGSLTAASELLGYTQSGITRMINSLEDDLGFALFVRSKKGVELTPNGKMMVPIFRDAVRAFRNVGEVSADIRGTIKGALSIGSYYSVSAMWLPKLLKDFQAAHPGIKINMREGGNREMSKWLAEKSVDMCFCAKPSTNDYEWLELARDEMVAWLPKSHPFAQKKAFPVKNLEKEPFIHTQPGMDTEIDRMLDEQQLRPDVAYSTKDAFTTYNMVAAGLGISCNQRLISKKWSKEIAEVSFSPKQYLELGIVVPSIKEASPAAKRFIEFVQEYIKKVRS